MVTRVNGAPAQGFYFSKDVRIVTATVTNGDFINDLTIKTTSPHQADVVNSSLELTLEAIATRGTIIGVAVVDATNVAVMVDYAQAYDPANEGLGGADVIDVEAEVIAAISANEVANSGIDLTCTALTILDGFVGAALVTPT